MSTEDDTTTSLRDLATDDDTGQVRLPGRHAVVTFSDRSTITVRITNREYLAWDKDRGRMKYPPMDEAPNLAGTFLAHRAALRDGLTTLKWAEWQEQVETIVNQDVDEDGEDTDPDRPTQQAAQPTTS